MPKQTKIPLTKGSTPYVLAALLFVAGILLGRSILSPSLKAQTLIAQDSGHVQETTPTGSHINPLINCIEGQNVNMAELQLFKPQVTEYIQKEKERNKNLVIAYYFRDLNNGLWLGFNEREQFSPASLMKVPVLLTVLKEAESNPHLLDLKIQYNAKDFEWMDEESGFAKKDGQWYSIEELMRYMIEYSDNASTVLLIQYVGVEKVAMVSRQLNLKMNSKVNSETNFVMIKSYAGIFRVLYNASFLNREMSEKALSMLSASDFKGGIRAGIPSTIRIAHKYGERDHIGLRGERITDQLHHFGIVYYPHKPFLVGVMVKGGNKEEMNRIISELAHITYENVDKQMILVRAGKNNASLN